jgi:hypothetical protein
MSNSQNRKTLELNPISNELELVNDLELGFSVRNVAKAPFIVRAGFTRVYPNLAIPLGMEISVEDDGELQVT